MASMPLDSSSHLPPNAERYRTEAARLRVDAERFTDENMRQRILDIAAQYDRLADSLDLHGIIYSLRESKR
jgi:hypothetical protein